jgi:hypothetical protein
VCFKERVPWAGGQEKRAGVWPVELQGVAEKHRVQTGCGHLVRPDQRAQGWAEVSCDREGCEHKPGGGDIDPDS